MARDDSEDIVLLSDDDDGQNTTKNRSMLDKELGNSKRLGRRGRDASEDDWDPKMDNPQKKLVSKTTRKSNMSRELLALTCDNDSSSQRKRSGSPTANPKYQKATRRPSPQRESGMNHRVSNDTVAQMLGVLMARVDKLETDRKKIAPLEEKMNTIEETLNACQGQVTTLMSKVENGPGSGAISKIMENLDRMKMDVNESKEYLDKRLEGLEQWKTHGNNRMEGLKLMLKSNNERLKNVEQSINTDLESTVADQSVKISDLEKSIEHLNDLSKNRNHSQTFQNPISQPIPATPEQLKQLPPAPFFSSTPTLNQGSNSLEDVLPFDSSSFDNLEMTNPTEPIIPPETLDDIINCLDSESILNANDSNLLPKISPQIELPMFSPEEEETSSTPCPEGAARLTSVIPDGTSRASDPTIANDGKPAAVKIPVKISLLNFKKKTTNVEDKVSESITPTNIQSPSTGMGRPFGSLESYNKEVNQNVIFSGSKESEAVDSSVPKTKNKFFKSKN